MTETLMDFLSIVTPPGTSASDPATARCTVTSTTLDRAKTRFDARLSRMNADIAKTLPGGYLIGVPLCPSACRPGPLADFVLSLGTDPYDGWNMLLYANNSHTAYALDTVPYHPDYIGDIDAVMVEYLVELEASLKRQITAPLARIKAKAAVYEDHLLRLMADCERIEHTLFGARKRHLNCYPETIGSPPRSAISPDISSGTGAENESSAPLTG